ncbi:MAG: LOG family protein [Sedimentisphaerales bacterium]|nr:LOG family protein [Sedimentisphaerales bacterium]
MDDKIITVFGTGRAKAGEAAFDLAYEVGRELARAGFTIANGGYGGTMLAGAKGACEAGGEVIGVTCSAFKGKANEFISREIVTGSLNERLSKLVELGRAFIVLPGGTGTLLELAMVWELRNKGFLDSEKPIILLGGFWKPLVDVVASDDFESSRSVEQVDGVEQAVRLIIDD